MYKIKNMGVLLLSQPRGNALERKQYFIFDHEYPQATKPNT